MSGEANPSEPAPSLRPVEELQALCDAIDVRAEGVMAARPHLMTIRESNLAQSLRDVATLTAEVRVLLVRLRVAEETLAAVGALHQEVAGCCSACVDDVDNPQEWPCSTAAALTEGASR